MFHNTFGKIEFFGISITISNLPMKSLANSETRKIICLNLDQLIILFIFHINEISVMFQDYIG